MSTALQFETLNMLRSYARSIGLLLVGGAEPADPATVRRPPVEAGITPERRAKLHLAAHLLAQATDTALPLTCPICVSATVARFDPEQHMSVFHQPPTGPDEALSDFLRALPGADEHAALGDARRALEDALLEAPAAVVDACHTFAERELDRLREVAVVAFGWRATVREHGEVAQALTAAGYPAQDGETLPATFKRAWEALVAERERLVVEHVRLAGILAVERAVDDETSREISSLRAEVERLSALKTAEVVPVLEAFAARFKMPEVRAAASPPTGGFTPRTEITTISPARFDSPAPAPGVRSKAPTLAERAEARELAAEALRARKGAGEPVRRLLRELAMIVQVHVVGDLHRAAVPVEPEPATLPAEVRAAAEEALRLAGDTWTLAQAQDGEALPDGTGYRGDYYETPQIIVTPSEGFPDGIPVADCADVATAERIIRARTLLPLLARAVLAASKQIDATHAEIERLRDAACHAQSDEIDRLRAEIASLRAAP